jgi:hypothetical protein
MGRLWLAQGEEGAGRRQQQRSHSNPAVPVPMRIMFAAPERGPATTGRKFLRLLFVIMHNFMARLSRPVGKCVWFLCGDAVPIPLFMKRITSIPWTLDDIRFRIRTIIIETRVRLRARVLEIEVGQ